MSGKVQRTNREKNISVAEDFRQQTNKFRKLAQQDLEEQANPINKKALFGAKLVQCIIEKIQVEVAISRARLLGAATSSVSGSNGSRNIHITALNTTLIDPMQYMQQQDSEWRVNYSIFSLIKSIVIAKFPVDCLQKSCGGDYFVDIDNNDDNDDSIIDIEQDSLKLEQWRLRIQSAVMGEVANFTNDSDITDATQSKDGYNLQKCPSLLPSWLLLRAPLLASMPKTNDDLSQYHCSNLPTPMMLAKECHDSFGNIPSSPLQYGSLQELHLRGRFLDGPSSYHNAQLGDIQRVQNRIRFQISNVFCSLQQEPYLSIKEQIMQSSA